MEENQKYCITARDRNTGITDSIAGPMSLQEARAWVPKRLHKLAYVYFRIAEHPFKAHK